MDILYKRIDITEENIEKLESARYDAYQIDSLEIPCNKSFYANEIRKNKYIIYAALINEQIVSACYISNAHQLFIEQLFTIKEYISLNIGKELLKFVLSNKKEIEDFFNQKLDYSYLSIGGKNLVDYYKKIGYKEINDVYMKKRI